MRMAVASMSLTRTSARATVSGDPIGPPEICLKKCIVKFKIRII